LQQKYVLDKNLFIFFVRKKNDKSFKFSACLGISK